MTAYAAAASLGPTLVDEAIDRCEAAMEQTEGDRQSEAALLAVLSGLYAMQGEFDHARSLATRSRVIFEELGLQMETARLGMDTGALERLAGNLEGAVSELRRAYDALDAVGERFARSTVAGFLAQALLEQGKLDEASVFCERSRELTTEADIATQALWRYVRARIVLAQQGAPDEAEQCAREAVELLEATDAIVYQIEARVALAETLVARDRLDEAREALASAEKLAETKGGVVILTGVLRRLEDLDAALATRGSA